MICYLDELTSREIAQINDFWSFSDDELKEFRFTVSEIDSKHKLQTKRAVMSLIKKSSYFLDRPGFICQHSQLASPATSRADYKRKINLKNSKACKKCLEEIKRKQLNKAQKVLDEYREKTFKPADYLDELNLEELIALLAVTSNVNDEDQYLGNSFQDISITGVQTMDFQILASLVEKGALIYIPELPAKVKEANKLIYPTNSRLSYAEGRYKNVTYFDQDSIRLGVYLNSLMLSGSEILSSQIESILYQKLGVLVFTVADSQRIHHIVKLIQSQKLFFLVNEVQKESKVPVEDTQVLRSLLDHLAENYSPLKLNFTFNIKARDTAAYIYKEQSELFKARHYFTKFVSNYIDWAETNGVPLDKTWSLPVEMKTSYFEALFSQLYLNGHFDWNKLSVKEIIALWLDNVTLDEEASVLPAK